MAMVTTSAPVMGEVQIFHKETLTNPTDNIHNVGDFAAVITTAKKIPLSRQILSSKHLKGQLDPPVGDGNVFAPKEVSWDPVLVT